MAKDVKPEAEVAAVAPPKKSKKLLIIIIVAVVLVLILGGGAAFLVLKARSTHDGEGGEAAAETAKSGKKKGEKEVVPVYVALDAFTVNLVPENGDQFLQLMISVEVEDAHVGEKLKMYTPKLRNNVMLLLSGKKAAELMTKEGKETLANEVRDLMNGVLEPGANKGEGPVREVLFTSFIIQ
ncbi:flagellar basal body-associated FliL family protein [Propionivibrio sp.]|uniref:flagellar basal body-associated FliL family protein n=1 Tax=Propionivibrio sp. TaxID=2212460 RepID=UPI0025DC424C|nr:flagellar basal body-associated FliL family protein [Propionivibrio sp.]MBK7355547.1 flagellar basal body-associated FliL family protein [Propionivibrio sp.]MBK8400783.1 flagellar basal body-associated FliL family protein [Propionivibrio sp.]MBK8744809.1 flagellar basal body-associated FliL family protein [Propionivibrio sp.]MBK8893211.1 flagellar basal body-associated FliL family protein [Propionivibrio sp.]MBL0207813.1 flagellar basal body-associated FliL family protein [Propionivibrio sp